MAVGVYLRVSSDHQSTESQLVVIKRVLSGHGITEFEIYRDEGISGTRTRRPGLDKLLADVEAGNIKTVVTYSLSRLSRSVAHLLSTLKALEAAKVNFISVTESIDLSTPAGRMLMVILGSIAEFERELIVQRVKAGLEAAKKRGVRLGRSKTRPSNLILQLKAEGMSFRRIAKVAGCSVAAVQRELASVSKQQPLDKAKNVSETSVSDASRTSKRTA